MLGYIYGCYLWDAGLLFDIKTHFDIWYFLCWSPGLLPRLIPLWCEYFNPSFHPWTFRDIRHAIPIWNDRLTSFKLTEFNEQDSCDYDPSPSLISTKQASTSSSQ